MSGMALARSSNAFKFELVDGTTATTDIAVADITTSDELVFVGHFSTKASIASLIDDTANCSVTTDGNIQSATDTSSDLLMTVWNDITSGSSVRSATCLRFEILAGTTASTNIAVTGATTSDEVLFAGHFSTAASIASVVDDTANCSFTTDGNLQSVTDTSSDMLFVIWNDLTSSSAGSTRSAYCLQVSVLAGANATTNIAVAGSKTTDEVLFVGHGTTASALESLADLTSEGSFTTDGQFQMSSTATGSDTLWLWWNKTSI